MKWIFVTALAALMALVQARPGDNLFEIEKQRLVKFPEETFRLDDNEQKSSEAKRILEEINKINVALGYVKKQEPPLPSMLNSDQFLFPKPMYHPFHSQVNAGALQPSIRKLNFASDSDRPSQLKSKESTKPNLFFYYYVPKSINIPSDSDVDKTNFEVPLKLSTQTKDEYVKEKNPREFKLVDYKVVGDVDISPEEKPEDDEKQSPRLRLYFVPRQLKLSDKPKEYMANQKLTRVEKLPTIRPSSKASAEKAAPSTKTTASSAKKFVSASPTTTTSPTPAPSAKAPFGSFFNRPGNVLAAQKVEAKPVLQSVPLTVPQSAAQQQPKPRPQQQPQPQPQLISNEDYTWGMESSEESDYPQELEKHIFSVKRKEMNEVQKEALKESGIIIQRLKVRKGGIAIAGPGGVATAGSGGTAIVGPGGYALTHPRSLTIAGPGAKVIAIPQTTDLKDALLRTNSGKSFADEGEVVATGPIIYYSPDDDSQVL